jgi:VWFA-related protein
LDTRTKLRAAMHRAVLLFSCLTLSCNAALARPQQPEENRIKTAVSMVVVGVTVTDSAGKFVEHLRHGDFTISDDGIKQPVSYFAVDLPTDVLILIEAGPAVYLMEGGHLRAASRLLDGLSAQDRVAVVKYADKPEGVSDFSGDKRVALQAFDHLNFNLGFGALNLSDSLATLLDWMDHSSGPKTIVLLSTGLDTSSPEANAKLLQRLRLTGPRILAVSLLGDLRTPKRSDKKRVTSSAAAMTTQQFDNADQTLRQLAIVTGGRSYFPANAKEFAAAYQEISEIVGHQYILGYASPIQDEKVHILDVQMAIDPQDRPDGIDSHPLPLRVDHRQAYLARKITNFSLPDGEMGRISPPGASSTNERAKSGNESHALVRAAKAAGASIESPSWWPPFDSAVRR